MRKHIVMSSSIIDGITVMTGGRNGYKYCTKITGHGLERAYA